MDGAPGPRELWKEGSEVTVHEIGVEDMEIGSFIAFTDASYYGARMKVAGTLKGVDVQPEAIHYLLSVTGTTSEGLLKYQSGRPGATVRVHRCPGTCTGERIAEDLVHGLKMQRPSRLGAEEGWMRSLEAVDPVDPGLDELAALRARDAALAPARGDHPEAGGGKAAEDKDKRRSPSRKKEKKKEKRKSRGRSPKKKKKERHRSPSPKEKDDKAEKAKSSKRKRSSSTCSSKAARLDGRQPRLASMKDYDALYAGTGLDRKEKVRRRVLHRAKKAAKRKSKDKTSSGSGSSSSRETSDFGEEVEDTLFEGETKIQRVAQRAPGALAWQALTKMRANLLQEAGAEQIAGTLGPVATLYMRQHLQKRATGPAARELLTLAMAADLMLKARPSKALDVVLQRMKAVEAGLMGSHWSVTQRLEIGPGDLLSMTGQEELVSAQRAAHSEARTRMLASYPEGRARSGKAEGKSKDKGRDKGKGKGGKEKGKAHPKEDHQSK